MCYTELLACEECFFTGGDCEHCNNTRVAGAREPHVCPPPFAPEVARGLAAFHVASQIPVSQTFKARIKLGLGL